MAKRKCEELPTLDDWLKKRNKVPKTTSAPEPDSETDYAEEEHMLPNCLLGIPNIPISLLPAPPGSLNNLLPLDWG